MSQEKYMQHYVEILTATMTDCIVRNVSMQANAKLKDELFEQLNEKVLEFKSANDELSKTLIELKEKSEKSENENNNEVSNLKNEVGSLTRIKNEYENLKSQLVHLETFRKELIKERENHESTKKYYEEKIKELNEKIELLESPPKKKKQLVVKKEFDIKENIENIVSLIKDDNSTKQNTKDGGTF